MWHVFLLLSFFQAICFFNASATIFFLLSAFHTTNNDFSIDTPGVISRVSYLFRGHNNLIQGFNTFLPPGYRIECSMDPSDPNPIRVTTPRGSTSRPEPPAMYDARWRPGYPQESRQTDPQQSPIQQIAPERYPNSSYIGGRNGPPGEGPNGAPINQAPEGPADGQQAGAVENRRPGDPVEFNYAISYVNKIKTRFANQPDIYNSFLEILQTYHRDQLRINEVYVQVTQLFKDAPDLLDDFKQFLPDMSQQQAAASQQAGIPHQQPGQPSMHHPGNNIPPPQQHMAPPSDNVRLPPVGNFSPPSIGSAGPPGPGQLGPPGPPSVGMAPPPAQSTPSGRGKKRNSNANVNENILYQQQQQLSQVSQQHMGGAFDMGNVQVSNTRGTANPKKSRIRDDDPPSPNLVPAIPEALDNHGEVDNHELMEEITFFDKAKRFIANKQTYNEFLKVLNLFSQRVIDKGLLVERVEGFLGGNRELMNWFKDFIRYDGKPLHIENIPYKKHLLELSLCRSYGRSYRLLPKSEPYMPCSGRDEMCWEVLNDEWVGHPVWASEEAGFVAHRKNQYEEIMHRVEEERHEYDYYIEANLRSIQTLETLASRIANMPPEEKAVFKLPSDLGHTSTIYEKVLKKIYGEPRYHEVVDALRETPAVAVPIVLRRMKQKDEEWKRAHREWNKVWRDTEQKVFYKSLDHRGLTFKQTDKKYLTTRQLVSEITTVKTEQSNKKISPLQANPKEQLLYNVKDYSVLMDLLRIVMCFLSHTGTYSSNDRERMELFFKSFLKLFFSVPEGMIQFPDDEETEEKSEVKPDEDVDMKDVNGTSTANGSLTNGVASNGSKKRSLEPVTHMLRDILKKSKQAKRFRDDPQNAEDEEEPEEEEEDPIERTGNLWMKHQSSTMSLFEERRRDSYNLFANNTVYVFLRLIIILYERLEEVKSYESVVSDEIANSRNVQFAIDLDLYDHRMSDMGLSFESKDCYGQLLSLIERVIEGDLDHQWYEESIRQAYRNRAYKLYTVDKVAQAIVKHLHNIISDVKSSDVLVLWENDRCNPLTSTKDQILYRMRVKSVLGPDENLFRVEWNDKNQAVMIQYLSNEDVTLKRARDEEEEWNYYLTSYLMSGPTEGVPTDKVRLPFLQRNLVDESFAESDAAGSDNPKSDNLEGSSSGAPDGDFIDSIEQGLAARISLPTYKMFFEPGTSDYFSRKVGVTSNTTTKKAEEKRSSRWNDLVEGSTGWKKDLDDTQVAELEARYNSWKNDKPTASILFESVVSSAPSETTSDRPATESLQPAINKDNDVTMSDLSMQSASSGVSDLTKSVIEHENPNSVAASSDPQLDLENTTANANSTTTIANPSSSIQDADKTVDESDVTKKDITIPEPQPAVDKIEPKHKSEEPKSETSNSVEVSSTTVPERKDLGSGLAKLAGADSLPPKPGSSLPHTLHANKNDPKPESFGSVKEKSKDNMKEAAEAKPETTNEGNKESQNVDGEKKPSE